jgi:hypothetical protein
MSLAELPLKVVSARLKLTVYAFLDEFFFLTQEKERYFELTAAILKDAPLAADILKFMSTFLFLRLDKKLVEAYCFPWFMQLAQ